MTRGRWRHPNCLDVDIYITKVRFRGPDYIKANVLYILQRNNEYLNSEPDKVRILQKDFKKWRFIRE